MDKKRKRKIFLILAVIVVGTLVEIGLISMANSGPFKINGFEIISQSLFVAWVIIKMVAILFWQTITGSWISFLVFIGIIILVILKYAVERNEENNP